MVSSKLKDYLDEAGVAYKRHSHPAAYTSMETAHSVHIPGREMVKSVMLKVDSKDEDGAGLVMAVLSANDAANLDILREEIGCGVLRLANESEFQDAFPTCKPGAMPPFGNIFNVLTFCEASLARNREIEFNAGTHEETIRMSFDDYQRLAKPKMVHFAEPYSEGLQRLAA
jgi:Ala-tRNA(Pro) deacylase